MTLLIGNFVEAIAIMTEPDASDPTDWHLNLEFFAPNGLDDEADVPYVGAVIAEFVASLLMDPFRVDRIILRDKTYKGAYDPTKIAIYNADLPGARELTSAPGPTSTSLLPLTNVLNASKVVGSGYPGRLSLRGFLTEADIVSSDQSGAVVLANPAAIQLELTTAYAAMAQAFQSNGWIMAMFGKVPDIATWRPVGGLAGPTAGIRQMENSVSARYPRGLFGDILRTIDSVKDSAPALQAIAEALAALEWLAPILVGGVAARRR